MTSFEVIAAGHICLDIIPPFTTKGEQDFGKLFQPGKLVKIDKAVLCTGGPVSNTGIALSKLGCRVAFVAKVGDDAFGQIIIAKMSAWGNVTGMVRDREHGSSYSVILAPPAIDRIILHHPGCNDFFTSAMLDWDLIRHARLFHLGYPPLMRSLFIDDGKELARIFQKVKALGLTTALDMALPDPESEAGQWDWSAWFENVMPHVDLFLPSMEEMMLLRRRSAWESLRRREGSFMDNVELQLYRDLAEELLALGCGVVLLKSGHRGVYLKTAGQQRLARIGLLSTQAKQLWANRELWGAAFLNENIHSAAGSGDSAVAGFLTAMLHGKNLEETLQFSNCLGYQNLRALDTVSGVGTFTESETLLATLQPHAVNFLDATWQRTSHKGVWERSVS